MASAWERCLQQLLPDMSIAEQREYLGRIIDAVRLSTFLPGQKLRRLVLTQLNQNFLEALHQIFQVCVNLGKPRNNVIGRRLHRGAESF